MSAVELRDVHQRFGDHEVLRGVSLRVEPGETVALIGPSGGGKSTLLRCINGLCPFERGEIRVGAHVLVGGVTGGPAHARNHDAARAIRNFFGMVFQDFQLFPHLTAVQNVALAPVLVDGRSKDEARTAALALLDRVGLRAKADAYPRALSGGQKQRVAIARALARRPKGLLCDEITSALDPQLRHEVVAVLEDLRRDGLTLLIVTHELAFARRAADRVVFMEHGAVVESGPARAVLDAPADARTQSFVRDLRDL